MDENKLAFFLSLDLQTKPAEGQIEHWIWVLNFTWEDLHFEPGQL